MTAKVLPGRSCRSRAVAIAMPDAALTVIRTQAIVALRTIAAASTSRRRDTSSPNARTVHARHAHGGDRITSTSDDTISVRV